MKFSKYLIMLLIFFSFKSYARKIPKKMKGLQYGYYLRYENGVKMQDGRSLNLMFGRVRKSSFDRGLNIELDYEQCCDEDKYSWSNISILYSINYNLLLNNFQPYVGFSTGLGTDYTFVLPLYTRVGMNLYLFNKFSIIIEYSYKFNIAFGDEDMAPYNYMTSGLSFGLKLYY